MVKKILLFVIALLLSSCNKQVESLKMKREPYLGGELRIDGYYYSLPNSHPWGGSAFFIFNRNGVCMYIYTSTFFSDEDDLYKYVEDKILLDEDFIKELKEKPHGYGVFSINYPNIKTETFIVRGRYNAYHNVGQILNDTTFIIHKEKGLSNKWFESNTIYHFKQFSPKPDSTNIYIK